VQNVKETKGPDCNVYNHLLLWACLFDGSNNKRFATCTATI